MWASPHGGHILKYDDRTLHTPDRCADVLRAELDKEHRRANEATVDAAAQTSNANALAGLLEEAAARCADVLRAELDKGDAFREDAFREEVARFAARTTEVQAVTDTLDTKVRAFLREHNIVTASAWGDLHDLIAEGCAPLYKQIHVAKEEGYREGIEAAADELRLMSCTCAKRIRAMPEKKKT
jgi:hypothetical protein